MYGYQQGSHTCKGLRVESSSCVAHLLIMHHDFLSRHMKGPQHYHGSDTCGRRGPLCQAPGVMTQLTNAPEL